MTSFSFGSLSKTDSHQLFASVSKLSPLHSLKGVPVGQFLLTRRNCTSDECFRKQAEALTARFRQRGYPRKTISRAFQWAKTFSQDILLVSRSRPQDSTLRFITEYNTRWNQVKNILTDHCDILTKDAQNSTCVSARPLMTARRAPNLCDILMKSHFSLPVVRQNRGSHLSPLETVLSTLLTARAICSINTLIAKLVMLFMQLSVPTRNREEALLAVLGPLGVKACAICCLAVCL